MTTFLLLISLFLNVLALFAIIILFLRQNRFLQVEKKQEKMLQEMEEVISTYLVQMKEENEEFINRINKIENKSKQSPVIDASVKLKNNGEKLNSEGQSSLQTRMGKASAYSAVKAYKQNAGVPSNNSDKKPISDEIELPPLESNESIVNENEENAQEQSLLNDILQLKSQGYNETEIAQKLNKGKTEINLLLKFNQNK